MTKEAYEKIRNGLNCAVVHAKSEVHACNCIGPQNGQPVCPCSMRTVTIVNGRYVRTIDIGPAFGGEGTERRPHDIQWSFEHSNTRQSDISRKTV